MTSSAKLRPLPASPLGCLPLFGLFSAPHPDPAAPMVSIILLHRVSITPVQCALVHFSYTIIVSGYIVAPLSLWLSLCVVVVGASPFTLLIFVLIIIIYLLAMGPSDDLCLDLKLALPPSESTCRVTWNLQTHLDSEESKSIYQLIGKQQEELGGKIMTIVLRRVNGNRTVTGRLDLLGPDGDQGPPIRFQSNISLEDWLQVKTKIFSCPGSTSEINRRLMNWFTRFVKENVGTIDMENLSIPW